MHLKEIQLENFKSFGRKMRIPFLEGFTSITGPNGAGKSNISDAILFVLGPRSSKTIRAGRLTDLIYKGGNGKGPAKFCRVSLVFDNSDRAIPIDEDEVTLTRIVKISPSDKDNYLSYFYINGRTSSLTEFEELLAYARISGDGYNIVQQGDVNKITLMTNLERRRILDDIAGITRFDTDIARAEDKRKGVESNLERIGIILEEVRRQISQLQRERNSALRYKELQDELKLKKAQLAHKKKESLEAEISSINEQIKSYEKEKIELQSNIEKLKKEIALKDNELKSFENKIAYLDGEDAEQIREKISELRIEIARSEQSINHSKDEIEYLKEENVKIQGELSSVERDVKNLMREKDKKEKVLREREEELKGREKDYKELQELISKSDSKSSSIQRELARMKREYESCQEEMHASKLEYDRIKDKVERARVDIASLEESVSTYEFELKDIEFELDELSKGSKTSKENLKELQARLIKRRDEESKLSKQLLELEPLVKRLTQEYSQLKVEAEAVESVQKGYTRAVNAILTARDKGEIRGIHGTIAELGDVSEDYESALRIAAGMRMQSIVVENDETAARCISYLKKHNLGRATFLPLNKMIEGKPRGKALMAVRGEKAIGFALDLIKFDDTYRPAFWYVFGDTVVIKDLSTARKLMGGVRLVTLDGELVEASGAMIGGSKEKGLLRFGATLSELEKKAEELRKAVSHRDELSDKLTSLRAEIDEIQEKIRVINDNESSALSKINDLKLRKNDYISKIKSLRKEQERLTEENDANESKLLGLDNKVAELEEKLEQLEKEKEEKKKLLLESTDKTLADRMKKLQESINTLKNEVRDLSCSIKTLTTQIDLMKRREKELEEKEENNEKESIEHKSKIKKFKAKISELENELSALIKIKESMSNEAQELRDKRDAYYREVTELKNKLEGVTAKLETKSDLILNLQRKIPSLEDELAEILIEIENYDVEIGDETPSIEELKLAIQRCESSMQRLEPVNMRALEEYEIQVKRRAEMEEEVKRLNEQRDNLIKVVDELKKKKKDGLMKVFNAVNENFKEIYRKLSNGGEAELSLENPDEPFEGGLIIKARPVGKKVQRLDALSGGEKSLTALALIFAIQAYSPSPFYVLDEVDMYLDAINAENVAKMIRANSKHAQFIMISLRKVTLKEANHVYGVTIQKNGISDIIGHVNIAQVEESMAMEG